MIKRVYYESFDGEQFDTEKECIEYENSYKKPDGVILANRQQEILSDIVDENFHYENIWYIYFPSYADVEWFIRAGNMFGFDTRGVAKEGYYYYDEYDYEWTNIEQKRKNVIEKENEIKRILKGE